MRFALVVFAIRRDRLEGGIAEFFSAGGVTIIQVNTWHLALDIILMVQTFHNQV